MEPAAEISDHRVSWQKCHRVHGSRPPRAERKWGGPSLKPGRGGTPSLDFLEQTRKTRLTVTSVRELLRALDEELVVTASQTQVISLFCRRDFLEEQLRRCLIREGYPPRSSGPARCSQQP